MVQCFEAGKMYRIFSKYYKSREQKITCASGKRRSSFEGIEWDADCVFEFVEKKGIHHYFRAVQGDWLRTYTNAQLIGKKIQEV